MAMVEISKKQFEMLLEDYVSELTSGEHVEKLVMKMLRMASLWNEGLDWTSIARLVNKELQKQREAWGDSDE